MTRARRFVVRTPGGPPASLCILPAAVLEIVRSRGRCSLQRLCLDARSYGTVAADDLQHVVDRLVRAGELVRVVLGPHRDSCVAYAVSARPR